MVSLALGCGGSDTDTAAPVSDSANTEASTDGASTDSASAETASGDTAEADSAIMFDANRDVGTPSTPAPVDLGAAGNLAILAKSGISTVPMSAITGDIGVSPAAASYITGFSLIADSTNVFARSTQVTGKVFASNYAVPTPANLTTAIGDMQIAFTDAASRAPKATELGAGNIGGMTITTGVYKWGTGLLVPTDVTLNGSPTDVFIFQIAKDLTVSSGAKIKVSGGALAKNIYWQVSGFADIGTTAHLEGVLMTQTAITLRTGASINGRVFAQTAVSVDGSTVTAP